MPRSMQEIIDTAEDLADRFESYEPDSADQRDITPLADLREAVRERAHAEQDMRDAVAAARAAGYSWATLGTLLGTSGEAARQRYDQLVDH